ncbi:MAG: preprotein translocase subunit SecA [Chloroflexi bacterium]|nr:preprotein translocase subunit SecA [Chloroflexota bacterium]
MIGKLLGKLVGDPNEKQLNQLRPIAEQVNAHENHMRGLTDDDLAAMTYEFKARINAGESLDDILPEAFAAVREASSRVLGMRHFDVQMIGGVVLHQGKIAEMRTGEGKTLVATLAAYLNALDGKSVHVVTVNDYLAKRDAEWMGPVYQFMGLSVGCLQQNRMDTHASPASYVYDENYQEDGAPIDREDASTKFASVVGKHLRPSTKVDAYACDILYATNNELGFDYLRDHMVGQTEERVQVGLSYAIVDEVDNILIDEARTPLLISGPGIETERNYSRFASVASRLKPETDFEVDHKRRNVSLTEVGSEKAERMLGVETLYSETGEDNELPHLVENAIRAEHVFLRDREYVVRDGDIVLVDEFTGRLMEGRRFSDGLHQALEAKERVRVRAESATYATITLQNYFRMYSKLSGMTGTATTEAEEFSKIYKLEVVAIPTNREDKRIDHQDLIYMTEEAKWTAAAQKIQELSEAGRPVLVGTTTIEKSQKIADLLKSRGVRHQVLNAKMHESESHVIAQAGIPGGVTVATNMAGRGTDIILGGNPETATNESSNRKNSKRNGRQSNNGHDAEDQPETWQERHDGVIAKGGLFVLGTERHESRRIDNQLRGRCARQGDPGETQFFLSVEDDLVRRFGGDRIKGTLEMFKWDENIPVENSVLVKSVENAQQKVEGINFEIRKQLVDYDDVANTQRDVIYKLRDRIVDGGNFREEIADYIKNALTRAVETFLEGDATIWDTQGFQREIRRYFPIPKDLSSEDDLSRYFPIPEVLSSEDDLIGKTQPEIEKELHDYVDTVYNQRETLFGDESLKMIEHSVLLRVLDRHWVGHLTRMENMRQSIGLQAIGQRDPLVQYRTMSFQMFNEMNEEIRNEVARTIFHLAPHAPHQSTRLAPSNATPLKADALAAAQRIALAQASQQSVMSSANTQQGTGATTTVASVNAPTHAADGRRLSRRERRAIERENKKKQRSGAAR